MDDPALQREEGPDADWFRVSRTFFGNRRLPPSTVARQLRAKNRMNRMSRERLAAWSWAPPGRPRFTAPSLLLLGAVALASACSKDATGPGNGGSTVATVAVEAPSTTVDVGGLLQLTATARDADGNIVSGQSTTWSSTNTGVASVSSDGLVNGVVQGSATITATIGGKSGSIQIAVTTPTPVVLSTITPATLVPGQTAALTGSGFSTVPSANAVSIGGNAATVTAATATTLTVTVPSSLCIVPGPATVTVTVGGRVSNPIDHPVQSSGTTVTAAVGQMQFLQSGFCLQFGASAAAESYLVGVQNYSENVAVLTPVTVAMAATAPGPSVAGMAALPVVSSGTAEMPPFDFAREQRWARHREAELALRRREQSSAMPPMVLAKHSLHAGLAAASADAALAVPAVVNVGDNVTIRVPNIDSLCVRYAEITTVVKAVGTKSVWLEDTGNPTGGLTTSDYQSLASLFDNKIYANDVDYFGTPSDIDGNGRIVIVVSKEINKTNNLGFTTTADLRARNASCPSSDEGEIYYTRAPDPNGTFGDPYTTASALIDAPVLLAHEVTHIIQFSVRAGQATFNGTLQKIWELEGQATFAEEVAGHAVTGRTIGQNYGFDVAFNCVPGSRPCQDAGGGLWYLDGFVDLALYYGFNPDASTTPIAGAPEQCSWLDLASNGNTGPCYSGREVYGVPWLLLRYLSDRFGPAVGGEKQLQHQLILGNLAGFANVANAIGQPGQPLDRVLADWAASLYVDDRISGADPSLTIPSWNLLDIENRLVEQAHLRPRMRTFTAFSDDVQVRAGSTAYFIVSGTRAAAALGMRSTGGGALPTNMRVFIVRLQ